jgi:hypothetical protein
LGRQYTFAVAGTTPKKGEKWGKKGGVLEVIPVKRGNYEFGVGNAEVGREWTEL